MNSQQPTANRQQPTANSSNSVSNFISYCSVFSSNTFTDNYFSGADKNKFRADDVAVREDAHHLQVTACGNHSDAAAIRADEINFRLDGKKFRADAAANHADGAAIRADIFIIHPNNFNFIHFLNKNKQSLTN